MEGEMTYKTTTIYDFESAQILAEGLQMQAVCEETIQLARKMARELGHSVVVENRGTKEVYRITKTGRLRPVPSGWNLLPDWDDE